jgi:hypothetical protein
MLWLAAAHGLQYWSELLISPPLRRPERWKTPRWTPAVFAEEIAIPRVHLPHEPLHRPAAPPKMLAVP